MVPCTLSYFKLYGNRFMFILVFSGIHQNDHDVGRWGGTSRQTQPRVKETHWDEWIWMDSYPLKIIWIMANDWVKFSVLFDIWIWESCTHHWSTNQKLWYWWQCCRFSGFCDIPAKNSGFLHPIQFAYFSWTFWWLVCQDRTIIKRARCPWWRFSWLLQKSRFYLQNNFLKVAAFGDTCSNMHVLEVYEGKFRIFHWKWHWRMWSYQPIFGIT